MHLLRRGRTAGALRYGIALLGVALPVLLVLNVLTQDAPSANAPAVPSAQWRTATDRVVERLKERLEATPGDHEVYDRLGAAYLHKARETGDLSYFGRAEEMFLRSLQLVPDNTGAMTLMATLYVRRHEFSDAANWAESVLRTDRRNNGAYGILADAQIELGRFDDAFASVQKMVDLKPSLGSYARVSNARRLTGDVDGAIEAMELAMDAGPLQGEPAAWVRVQLGNLYLDSGGIDQAASYYEAALEAFEGYHLALAGLGKARAARGRYREAIDLYEQAVAVIPLPITLAALGDLYAKTGQTDQAAFQYETVEFIATLARINRQVYNRSLALYYADHDINLGEALALATRELESRKDIYGYDALAWALYKNGNFDRAADAVVRALELGTVDPNLYFHAGMIYEGIGDSGRAREYLGRALALNPGFSVLNADVARRELAKIDAAQASISSKRAGR